MGPRKRFRGRQLDRKPSINREPSAASEGFARIAAIVCSVRSLMIRDPPTGTLAYNCR